MKQIRKWSILTLMIAGIYFIGYSDDLLPQGLAAAPCIQECEDTEASCYDECNDACLEDSTREDCTSCIISCHNGFQSCLVTAIFCSDGENQYSPNCSVQFGSHCPVINGVANCSHPSAYNAYFLLCTQGGNPCVSCPSYRYCTGSGGVAACVPY